MRLLLIVLTVFFCSCATVRKDRSSKTDYQKHIDTSTVNREYQKETFTEEKGGVPVTTDADSAQTYGTMTNEDTSTHEQRVETDEISLTTTVKPKVKDGKITGYDINSKAVSKPKVVNVPVDRKTTIKESGTDKIQTGVTDTKNQTTTMISKQRTGASGWIKIVIIGAVILFLIWLIFKVWR